MSVLGDICDQIAEQVTPEQLAVELGMKRPSARTTGNYHCPFPERHQNGDKNPSAYTAEKNGRVSVGCRVCKFGGTPVQAYSQVNGCSEVEAARHLGSRLSLDVSRLNGSRIARRRGGLTLQQYADYTRLPVTYLQEVGLRDASWYRAPCVEVPYFDEDGNEVCTRIRVALSGHKRFRWPKGAEPILYGVDRLAEAAIGDRVLCVEGESDCHAARFHGQLVVGIPGANFWKDEWAEYFKGLRVVLWQEPGSAGAGFVRRLGRNLQDVCEEVGVVVSPEGLKDVCELHHANPEHAQFRSQLQALLDQAVPLSSWLEAHPTGTPVDGKGLLDDLSSWVHRYIWLPSEPSDAIALWVLLTWCVEELYFAPLLVVLSATKQCGKSTLRDLLSLVVRKPHRTSGVGITSPGLFRLNEKRQPTFLIDEAERLGGRNADKDLIGLLNDGYRRGATVTRCVESGGDYDTRDFDAFGFRALFANGILWDTVIDRAVVIHLKRKPRNENTSRFKWRQVEREGQGLERRIRRWVDVNLASIAKAEEGAQRPTWLSARACDNWSGLFAIAETVGGEWPERAEKTSRWASASNRDDTSHGELLIRDVSSAFEERGWPEVVASGELVSALNEPETLVWGDYRGGTGISARWLAKKLNSFDVSPRQKRTSSGDKVRGYWLVDLEEVFRAYLPNAELGQVGQSYNHGPSGRPSFVPRSGTNGDQTWDSSQRSSQLRTDMSRFEPGNWDSENPRGSADVPVVPLEGRGMAEGGVCPFCGGGMPAGRLLCETCDFLGLADVAP
jgi:hypothetical protein